MAKKLEAREIELPKAEALAYGVKPEDLQAGKNRVEVEGRGIARILRFITVGVDPIGGVLVEFEEGKTSCAFENNAALKIIGTAKTPVVGWEQAGEDDWVAFYEVARGTAARVDPTGWIVYSPGGAGGSRSGRGSSLVSNMNAAVEALQALGVDTSALVAPGGS